MPASMSLCFLKVPPQRVVDIGISIYRYVSDIFAPRNSSLNQVPPPSTGKGVVDFPPASGITRTPLTRPMRIKEAQAGAPTTEYHPEGESAEILFRIDQIPSATPKPVTPPKAGSLQPVQLKLHGHIETPTMSSPRMVGLGRQTHHDDSKALRRAAPGETRHAPTSAAFALTGQRTTHYELSGQTVFGEHSPLASALDKKQNYQIRTGPNNWSHSDWSLSPKPSSISSRSPRSDTATMHIFHNTVR